MQGKYVRHMHVKLFTGDYAQKDNFVQTQRMESEHHFYRSQNRKKLKNTEQPDASTRAQSCPAVNR